MKISQFLITRFNCRASWAPDNLGIDDDWLTHRFKLFENFCLPSVKSQDNDDFYWIILIAKTTPERWVTRLRSNMGDLFSRVIIMPVSWGSEGIVIKEIENVTANTSEGVITTRMDNDDAIASNYLSSISNLCQTLDPKGNYVINYSSGCMAHRTGIYAFNPVRLNPFISVLSFTKKIITAIHTNHHDMGRVGTVINVAVENALDPIMWMQVLHSKNIINSLQRNKNETKKISEENIRNFSIAENWVTLLNSV